MANTKEKLQKYNVDSIHNINDLTRIIGALTAAAGVPMETQKMAALYWIEVPVPRHANLVQRDILAEAYEEKYGMNKDEAGELAYTDALNGTIEGEIAKHIINLLATAGTLGMDVQKHIDLELTHIARHLDTTGRLP